MGADNGIKLNQYLEMQRTPEEQAEVDKFDSKTFMQKLAWRNIIIMAILHYGFFYSFYLLFTGQVKISSFIFAYAYGFLGAFGITGGAHRLYAHRAFKARLQLKLILLVLNCTAFQNSIYEWCRDHRVHHKYTDTTADPHNYQRGFFFAHMGWLMTKKHPDVKRKGAQIDLSDLTQDEMVVFQHKYYLILMPIFCFILPTIVGHQLAGESWINSFCLFALWRYVISLHLAWLVNSAAHSWGTRPFEKSIQPSNTLIVAAIAHGEGYHNYHHVFPWDYKSDDVVTFGMHFAAFFIETFAKIGWAYELKTASPELVIKRAQRTGDGSKYFDTTGAESMSTIHSFDMSEQTLTYGWTDPELDKDDKKMAIITQMEK